MITIYSFEEINQIIQPGKSKEEYELEYNKLIDECKKRGLDKGNFSGIYLETHHIIPRTLKGEDKESNYVLLTSAEHILAHILLWYIHPGHIGITIAAAMMVSLERRNKQTESVLTYNLKDIISKLDIKVVAEIRANRVNDARKPVICWDRNLLGDIVILKIYDYLHEVPLLENRPEKKGWRIIGDFVDDEKRHSGYFWGSLEYFEEIYPEILEQYLENPTPKDKQIPIKSSNPLHDVPIIVCHDESFNVFKIYINYQRLIEDGLGITLCKTAASKNGGESRGYYWSYLDWFRENHRDKLEKFINEGKEYSITPKAGKTSPKSVLIYDPKTYQVLRVYETSHSAKKDGFDGFRLAKKAEERCKGGDNNYNGHYVSYVKYWEYPDKLQEYYDNPPLHIEVKNNMADTITILKCDFNKDIIAIFENRLDLDVGGIWDNTLSEKIDRELLHRGYYYYHPAYYKEHYTEKWKNYLENGCTGLEEFNSKNVVTIDSDFNILELFRDEYLDRRKLKDDEEYYLLGDRKKTGILVWRLEKFVSKYPEKWENYLKHKQLNKLDEKGERKD